jgi:hypothetical protein
MGKIAGPAAQPEVTFFVESREESAGAESRGRFLLDKLGGGDVASALAKVRGRVSIALSLRELALDAALIDFLREYNALGIPIDIWPNMEDEDGYWIHRGNARTAHGMILEMIDRLKTHSVDFQNIGLDLEFPIEILKGGFRLREFLRQKPWSFSDSDSQMYIADLIWMILRETPYGVRSYEIPILGDGKTKSADFLRKILGVSRVPEAPRLYEDSIDLQRFGRIGLVYTSVKPRLIGGPPEQFVKKYSAPFGRVPALGIVSATDINPAENLGRIPCVFSTPPNLHETAKPR